VAAGSGELPEIVRQRLSRLGIDLDVTLLDRASSHLAARNGAAGNHIPRSRQVVGDALVLPFGDGTFDLVSCNLFVHHLDSQQIATFVREALRVSRLALLVNDLIRHRLHLALAWAGFPLMRSRIAWLDGLTSVRRSYRPDEMRGLISSAFPGRTPEMEISRSYLFRMGVIVWKNP
jgi:2-polyprenyl-3-methyl-5-hydroxy-6-metoxy-1,4-benzoquinol methylase